MTRFRADQSILGLCAIICATSALCLGSADDTARLRGSVQDGNGNAHVCESCYVTVTGAGIEKMLRLDQTGSFHAELSPGVYRITTNVPHTYPIKRAAFKVQAGETLVLVLVPRVRDLAIGTEVGDKGLNTFREVAKPRTFEELEVGPGSDLKAGIEFETKQEEKQKIIYNDAVLSFDAVTVYADTITYDKSTRGFEARDDRAVIDYGGTRRIASRVIARFSQHARCLEFDSRK